MPLLQTSGNDTADAYAGGIAAIPNYIEDVFSTYLYTGNGSTQTITNGIDLAGKGGLVWTKVRSTTTTNVLIDTVRGDYYLQSNATTGQSFSSIGVYNYSSTGYDVGAAAGTNANAQTFVGWTFRKQPKFFDIVTYTGDGVSGRTISHNLASDPGCIIVKRTDTAGDWKVYISGYILTLNSTAASGTTTNGYPYVNSASNFQVFSGGGSITDVNASGGTYVAYLFGSNSGGFGLTGTDNVISCGDFTTNGSGNATVSLGYEPQYLLLKASSGAGNWIVVDVMRGWSAGVVTILNPNLTSADAPSYSDYYDPTSTGFKFVNGGLAASTTYIYVAIRRGPMKVPTLGTNVFYAGTRTGTAANATVDTSATFPTDLSLIGSRNTVVNKFTSASRLIGNPYTTTNTTNAESQDNTVYFANPFDVQKGVRIGNSSGGYGVNVSGTTYVDYLFKRAPSFFDEVCYTGTGSATTQSHNLGVAPEMIIIKKRSASGSEWPVYVAPLGATKGLYLGTTGNPAITTSTYWNNTAPTSSVFTVGNASAANQSGATYVAYLFATCAGVSKVGSYTGNGSSQTINCGFTSGARFVLIKNTDTTGEWYVYDTARGMISGTDPYLALNLSSAENFNGATTGCTTTSTGFTVIADGVTGLNSSGYNYIYLAIA